jgi:hypothetical protein
MKKYLNRINLLTLLLAIPLFLMGSQMNSQNRFAERPIENSEILGTWVPTELSIEKLISEKFKLFTKSSDHKIIFYEGGKCLYQSYYTYSCGYKDETKNYFNLNGTWWFGTGLEIIGDWSQPVPAIKINFSPDGHAYYQVDFYLYEKNGNLILWQFIGGPNKMNYFEFIKESVK